MPTPTENRFFLVMNPSSRSYRSQYVWPQIFDGLKQRNIFYDFGITENAEHTREITKSAVRRGFNAIIAVGGDGTINEVINGLFDSDSETANAVFGVLYTGTSPDFCKNHGIPLNIDKAIELLAYDSKVAIDVCKISHRLTPNGHIVNRIFSCCANFGLGAAVARGANSGLRKTFGDFFGTFFSLISAIAKFTPPKFRVIIDGKEKSFTNSFNIFIGKSKFVASGIKLNTLISHNDGKMYILPLWGISKLHLLSLLPSVYSGTITKRFPPIYGKEVEFLEWGDAPEVEYDGDPHGFLPAKIKILPKSLQLFRLPAK